ncbi:imidazole glycerol phosphate synthase subunit HisH [Candidatus Methylopumilus universalis]|uniref:imidazole glycerol phosphate synthase subunit HisH n=1 Tax=Candidatus Methylopumilus universalis TaxID=2588536 RepID=UPI0011235B83|nr:imidazole glycerol phosphate synthase subunit HisH [Candidatus Methylopumilus universalis]QDC47523.1 imidazole glycerol phosphate synthase subunit HisH [Candidatus Methylopumilus universalis]QDC72056.1 imidazole glycerol phosphate synthase subunit HisH [Candidatus Methylopumilus universalis]
MPLGAVAIVDYGMGNLRSVENAITHVGFSSDIVSIPEKLIHYNKIILPGVGGFGQAIKSLKASGMSESLTERKNNGAQILGICLGMQLMCKSSEEDGLHQGLSWFDAKVKRFPDLKGLHIPHMGWNSVKFEKNDAILKNLESGEDAYFVHSYHVACNNSNDKLAVTEYGLEFTSMIQRDNLIGVQFHPEKSQDFGLRLIKSYLELSC